MKECPSKKHVLGLCSGSSRGNFSVELWVNLEQPFAWIHRQPIRFQKSNFHVAHRDPRRLLVRVHNDWLLFGCVVLHAPQSGQSLDLREDWGWNETRTLLLRFVEPQEFLISYADANAAPGTADGISVFNEGFATSKSTPLLRDFLDQFDLCLPITSDRHIGTTTTWTSPDPSEHTIDYVALPRSWWSSCVLVVQICSKSHDYHDSNG